MKSIYEEVNEIRQKGYDEQHHFFQEYSMETPNDSIGELLENFFERAKADGRVQDYTTDYYSGEDSPGYACGVIFMAWVTADGKLQATSYEWEAK